MMIGCTNSRKPHRQVKGDDLQVLIMTGIMGLSSQFPITLDQFIRMELKPVDSTVQVAFLTKEIGEHQVNEMGVNLYKLQDNLLWLISLPTPYPSVDIALQASIKHVRQIH